MARTYVNAVGTATVIKDGDRYLVAARARFAPPSARIFAFAYRDDAGFSGRAWRVDVLDVVTMDPASGTLFGHDQFATLRDIAETAIDASDRVARIEAARVARMGV